MKQTLQTDEDYPNLCEALIKIQAVVADVNEKKRDEEHIARMVDIQSKVSFELFGSRIESYTSYKVRKLKI